MISLVVGTPSLARAEYALLHATRTTVGTVLSCQDVFECFAGTQGCDSGGECRTVNSSLSICLPSARPVAFEAFCCATLDDCPQRGEVEAQACAAVGGDVNVCVYGGAVRSVFNLCAGDASPTRDQLVACFGSANATGVLTIAAGDCDGDGHLNNMDSTPCMSDSIAPPVDAGFPDFGVVDDDASVIIPPQDLGRDDLGGGGGDAGSNPSFRGAGGCGVTPAHDEQPVTPAAALALVALFGVLTRRGRR